MPADALTAMSSGVRSLIAIRVINQLGAFTLAFLAVVAGTKSAALVLTTFAVFTIPSRLIGAWLTVRCRPGLVVAGGLFGCACAMFLLVPAHRLLLLVGAAAVLGLVFEIYEPASQELIAAESTGLDRARSYNVMGMSLALAGVGAGVIAAILLPFGVRWLFVADGFTCLIACVLAVVFLRESARPQHPADRKRGRRAIPPPLLLLTLVNVFFASAYLVILIFLPLGLLRYGAPSWLPGVLLAAGAVLAMLADRFLRPLLPAAVAVRQGLAGCLFLALVAVGLATTSGVLLIGCYLLWSIANALLVGLWSGLIADAATPEDRPRWFAIHGTAWGIAQVLVSLPVAALISLGAAPLRAAGLVAAAGMMLAAVSLGAFPRVAARSGRPDPRPAGATAVGAVRR